VAEALAHGLPSIVFTGAPWAGLNERGAGWWIDPTHEQLVGALDAAMELADGQRTEMGRRAHAWVQSEFAWPEIGARMSRAYQWLMDPNAHGLSRDIRLVAGETADRA
jgi:glycosyltransferase involved in cell wall biosynthesis